VTSGSGSDLLLGSRGGPPSSVMYVADVVRDAILEGRIQPGQAIKEKPIAEQLGVSRGPIRDALRVLAEEGLVELRPHRSAQVPELAASDMLETYALRAAIGSLALRKLMLRSSPAGVESVRRQLDALSQAAAAEDHHAAVAADLAFQNAIVRASGLLQAARVFERLTLRVRLMVSEQDMDFGRQLETMTLENRGLYTAITSRDADLCARLWREKVERWVRHFIEGLRDEEFDAELWVILTRGT